MSRARALEALAAACALGYVVGMAVVLLLIATKP